VLAGEKFLSFRVGSGSGMEEERIGEPRRLILGPGHARGGRRRLELWRHVAVTRPPGRGKEQEARAGHPWLAGGGSHSSSLSSGGQPCRGGRRGRRGGRRRGCPTSSPMAGRDAPPGGGGGRSLDLCRTLRRRGWGGEGASTSRQGWPEGEARWCSWKETRLLFFIFYLYFLIGLTNAHAHVRFSINS
jgi:hypothetical protein